MSELEALLGDTVMRVPTDDEGEPDSARATLRAPLADFLGVGMTLDPIETIDGAAPIDAAGVTDLGDIAAPAALFETVQLGPLADLGPELAEAMAIIIATLEAESPH